MREIPFGTSISNSNLNSNTPRTSLPLSPPLSTSQTPTSSPPSFSHDSNPQKQNAIVNVMQEKHSSSPASRPPPSPTSPANTPDASLSAPVPNAWKVVGPPSGLHPGFPQASESGFSSSEGPENGTNEYGVSDSRTSGPRDSNHSDSYEEFDLELSSEDGYFEGPRLIGTRRSSEGAAFRAQNIQTQYNRDAEPATGDESAPNFHLSPPGNLGQRRGSDVGSSTSLGMGTSPNIPTKWGALGFQWTARSSIWNGNGSGTGRSNSVVGGSRTPPPDEAPATRSVSFSGIDSQYVGIGSGSRSPIGTGSSVARSPTTGVGSMYLGNEYDQEQQPQIRQARSLSFALGQQETDFFGASNNARPQTSNSSSSQTNFLATGRGSLAIAHSFDDSELFRAASRYGTEHHAPSSATSSSLRGLENTFQQSLPSMSEELEGPQGAHPRYDSLDDRPDASSLSPSEASYASFTLPKMRSRNKSSSAAFGGMGRETSASSHNSSSASSPMSRIRAPTGYNGLSPQQQPIHNSVTAPSSLSSSPYRHSASLGGLSGLPITSSAEDSTSGPAYANIWRGDSDIPHLLTHNAPNNQRRRSITTPNDYWPNSAPQRPGRLSVSVNASGSRSDNYTSKGESSSPELLERVRIHRRLSLNPAVGGGLGNTLGGMGGIGAGMGLGGEIGTTSIGMGSTGNYGEYRYLESGQGLGMLNRSVEPEYAHLNQRRHSVAGPTLSFGNSSQSRYVTDALEALQLDDNSMYGNQQHLGFGGGVEESSLDDYFDNDERRAARVAAATASGNYGGISSNANTVATALGGRGAASALGLSASRDADAHLGKGVPLHAVPHHGPLFIVEFKAGRSDLFYLVPESPSQQVKKGDLVIVEADRGKDLGKVVNDNITPVQVQMLQQQQAEAAAVAEMGVSSMVGGPTGIGSVPVKELHPKRIYRLAQPAEVTMLVTKSQDEAKAMLLCQTKVCQKNLPMEVVDAEYQWDRRKLTFYFIAERRIDFRELVRELFKIYKTRIWMCAVNPNMSSGLGMSALRK